ncbi:MAG: 50S ribosomal protein L13 [Candidatus Omnitrophica bacterium]|nr:50S ribosomal protein L13 [Candidatus Omnitrophota bacterium]
MNKTYLAKKKDVKKEWYIVDAKDKILGRLAARVATVLRGKHKAIYTPYVDTGDGVIVINASQIRVTGRKMTQKVYKRFSGYPSGLTEVTLEKMLARKPETVIKLAVTRMLPSGPLARDMIKKLRVFGDDKHGYECLKAKVLEV